MVRFLLTLLIILPLGIFAQTKNKVEVVPQILSEKFMEECKELEIGKIIFFYEPEYPGEVKNEGGSGVVSVTVNLEPNGNIIEIAKINGDQFFFGIALKAAQKAKFSPTVCDGKSIPVSALITYNFVSQNPAERYFFPANVKEFTDVKSDSPYFESISNLTDNYKISFGYSDNKFSENKLLTRGDFAQFLRMTLDLLFKRAKESNKIPYQIGLVKPFNLQNLASVSSVKDLDKKEPFYRSVGILLQTYNISLVNKDLNFQGKNPITKNEVIDLWTNIFGKEAVPVNFEKTQNGEQVFTRGEFALFLHESMQVLTYKVLP
jgi:TonB family protein